MAFPQLGENLSPENIDLLNAFSKSVRHTAIAMLKNSQSGHPGGSLSCADFLTLLYTAIISKTGEKVVVSNGHISPGVYGTLAEMKYIPKADVIETFRKIGSDYEGHITRHVPGVWFGTGPLGVGMSAAQGFAISAKLQGKNENVYCLIGDGEAQEGIIYEVMQSAAKYELDNFVVFVDDNKVQLTDSIEEIMPLNLRGHFETAGWNVLEVDGHDFDEMWVALDNANNTKGKPTVILGNTIMGKGVSFMEEVGAQNKSDWHGKAPSPEMCDQALEELASSDEERNMIDAFCSEISWKPSSANFIPSHTKLNEVDPGQPYILEAGTKADCRGAYGKALLDLAKRNPSIVAVCADLRGSVKTDAVAKELPNQHIEVGIAEQNMVSTSGGMSLAGNVPFCSTFGAFMSSRAKDMARVNDINHANVKMVATHCGLSVGEDGPTHQAIDDMGSFLGMFHTDIIEPTDPNQCDRIIRYVASHYGNFYVRMGRHKFPVLLKEDGSVFYDKDYTFVYGKSDLVREGADITILASGACVHEAVKAYETLKNTHPDLSVEIIAVHSIKKLDQTVKNSIQKTKKVLTVEDHNTLSGLGGQVGRYIAKEKLQVDAFEMLGVEEYQLSGTAADLYKAVGIDAEGIAKKITSLV